VILGVIRVTLSKPGRREGEGKWNWPLAGHGVTIFLGALGVAATSPRKRDAHHLELVGPRANKLMIGPIN